MKKSKNYFKFFISFLFALLIVSQIQAQEVSLKPYGIESGIIEYKYSGSQVGTSILYFDEYGYKSAMKMDTKMNDQPQKGWVVSFKEYQYIFDPANPDEGLKMKNPMIESLQKMDKPDFDKATEDMYSKMGFKKTGTEKFMDKDCIVFKGDMGKVLTWNGILMLMDMNYSGIQTKQEATSIKINVPIDEKYFEIPKNIKFSEMPGFGR
jgi:hypothetical protein